MKRTLYLLTMLFLALFFHPMALRSAPASMWGPSPDALLPPPQPVQRAELDLMGGFSPSNYYDHDFFGGGGSARFFFDGTSSVNHGFTIGFHSLSITDPSPNSYFYYSDFSLLEFLYSMRIKIKTTGAVRPYVLLGAGLVDVSRSRHTNGYLYNDHGICPMLQAGIGAEHPIASHVNIFLEIKANSAVILGAAESTVANESVGYDPIDVGVSFLW